MTRSVRLVPLSGAKNARFQAKNPNEMQTHVLEKPVFQIQKTRTFLCGSWARAFAKKKSSTRYQYYHWKLL